MKNSPMTSGNNILHFCKDNQRCQGGTIKHAKDESRFLLKNPFPNPSLGTHGGI